MQEIELKVMYFPNSFGLFSVLLTANWNENCFSKTIYEDFFNIVFRFVHLTHKITNDDYEFVVLFFLYQAFL